ncbi:hypothetical protein GCM10009765_60110 [Fodinicola feengrottensis]|uniref:DUF222 domain-containing protein n=1 Tax=Fodinicola feengrottensis TaxID=435914 RepID=A0ABN2IDG5_9ACTN
MTVTSPMTNADRSIAQEGLTVGTMGDAVARLMALVGMFADEFSGEHDLTPGAIPLGAWHDRACREAVTAVAVAGESATAAQVAAAMPELAEAIEELAVDVAADLAAVCARLVELGADPTPLVEPVFGMLTFALNECACFIQLWPRTPGQRPHFPHPHDDDATTRATVTEQLTAALTANRKKRTTAMTRADYGADLDIQDPTGWVDCCPDDHDPRQREVSAHLMTASWYTLDSWMRAALALLQDRNVRRALPDRDTLKAAVDRVRPWRGELHFVAVLLRVLDDEPLIVLHQPSGRGFMVTIAGIADLRQLHTLLAATMSGSGLLTGPGPSREQVAAADGSGRQRTRMEPFYDLTDCHGVPLPDDALPADIPTTSNTIDSPRMVILSPSSHAHTWVTGRLFDRMTPTLSQVRELTHQEAARWITLAPEQPQASTPTHAEEDAATRDTP